MIKSFTKIINYFGFFLLVCLLMSAPKVDAKKFKAVTTFTVIADMARNVAGDAALVESITKIGAEIHGYQPTPRDIIKAQNADLILWNGLNLENRPQFTQTNNGVGSFQFTESYHGPGLSNHTIIQRTTTINSVTDTTSTFTQ